MITLAIAPAADPLAGWKHAVYTKHGCWSTALGGRGTSEPSPPPTASPFSSTVPGLPGAAPSRQAPTLHTLAVKSALQVTNSASEASQPTSYTSSWCPL